MHDAVVWIYAALVGAMIGSFLNVCIYRLPAGESVVRPRSRCGACGAMIAWYDNIPVLSYILLRGRCRACGTGLSIQYPLIELATAALWLAAAMRYGLGVEALRSATFLTLLLGIALIDARHFIIPDHLSLGGAAIALALAAVPGGPPLVDAAAGAGVGYVSMRLIAVGGEALFRKPALGLGDVHMMTMVGAFLGVGGMFLTILLGSVLGLLIGVPVSWWRGRLAPLNTYLPLGTFLALGAAVAEAWGDRMIDWYLAFALGGG